MTTIWSFDVEFEQQPYSVRKPKPGRPLWFI